MQLNRALRDDENSIYDIVSGTFLVVGLGEEDFCSLTPEQIEKYSEHFAEPEMFFMLDGEIQAIPYNDPSKFPLYEKSFSEARDREEISAYRLSSRADNMCKTAIEAAINDNYSDCRLDPEGAKKVVENFGIDRVKKILALTNGKEASGYVKGLTFTVYEVRSDWGRTPSGWVCLRYCEEIK